MGIQFANTIAFVLLMLGKLTLSDELFFEDGEVSYHSYGCSSTHNGQPRVFLTVSSLAPSGHVRGVKSKRELEMNWYGTEPLSGDQVQLHDSAVYTPTLGLPVSTNPLVSISPTDYPSGYYRTDYTFNKYEFSPENMSSSLLPGYLIVYVRDDKVISSGSSIKTQPNWMWENREYLKDFRLRDILLPGTHDSGSILTDETENILTTYFFNQDEKIFNQLVYGNRVLDIRVGYYRSTPQKFWVNHDQFKTSTTILALLRDVKSFVTSTNEIVILDFHRFPVGFDRKNNQQVHVKLIELITQEVGDILVPRDRGQNMTLGQIWDSGKRLIIAYSNRMLYTSPLLWQGIHQAWADTVKIQVLKDYIQNYINSKTTRRLWAAMAEFTPSFDIALANLSKGLRGFADDVNRNVTVWFRDLWWKEANIVSTDFFLGNNMVNVAIEANRKRKSCAGAN